jgi:hypothetical protein
MKTNKQNKSLPLCANDINALSTITSGNVLHHLLLALQYPPRVCRYTCMPHILNPRRDWVVAASFFLFVLLLIKKFGMLFIIQSFIIYIYIHTYMQKQTN